MGKLVIDTITVEGFGSFAEPQTLKLGGRGVVGLAGPNGAGKSTIASKALSWCLYGKAAPERMGSGSSALRGKALVTEGAKHCRVAVQMTSADGHSIEIARHRTRTSADAIEVTHSGMELPNSQVTIDALIGADYDVFVRTCVRGQNDPWNFAEATDARKREILDVVSGASSLAIPYEKARKLATDRKHSAALTAQRLEQAERQLAAIDVAEVERKVAAWDADKHTRLQQSQAEVDAHRAHLATAEQAVAQEAAHVQARAALKASWPQLDAQPYREAVHAANGATGQARGAYRAAQDEAARLEALVAQGHCPTCSQPVTGATVAARLPDVSGLHAHVQANEAHLRKCNEAWDQAQAWHKNAVAQAQTAYDQIPAPVAAGMVDHARRAHLASQQRHEALAQAENPWSAAAEAARRQVQVAERDVAIHREALVMAERQQALAEYWTAALHPKGVRADLAESALMAIEAEANRWLTVLSGGTMTVRFPSEKTSKSGTVRKIETHVMMKGQQRGHLNLSGGEKRRINLAVDLGVAAAFARGGALALSILVLDEETFSGLDDAGKAGVAEAIAQAGVADVVVIDHDPRLADVLPRVVGVQRHPTEGYSMIVDQGD